MPVDFARYRTQSPLASLLGGFSSATQGTNIGKQIQEAQQTRQKNALQNVIMQQQQEKLKEMPQTFATAQEAAPVDLQLKKAQVARLQQPVFPKDVMGQFALLQKMQKANPKDPRLPILGQIIKNSVTPKHGISIGTDANGKPSIQIGGQPAMTGPSPFGTNIVNPLTKGARGAKGATYMDAKTGKTYSTPTTQETTQLQKSVLGDKQMGNIADTMVNDLKEVDFFNPATHAEAWASPAMKYLSPELAHDAASKRSNLMGVSNKAVAAGERLMTFTNAPKTEEMMHKAIAIFQPDYGEDLRSYKKRVMSNMRMFKVNAELARQALIKGIEIGHTDMPYVMHQLAPRNASDYIYPRYEYMKNPDYKAPAAAPTQQAASQQQVPINENNIAFTAKKYGLTVDQVKSRLKKEGKL
jgi:hypothetical protein